MSGKAIVRDPALLKDLTAAIERRIHLLKEEICHWENEKARLTSMDIYSELLKFPRRED